MKYIQDHHEVCEYILKLDFYLLLLLLYYLLFNPETFFWIHGLKMDSFRFLCFEINSNEGGCPRGVMITATDCRIVVREFILQSRYYVHFRAKTLGKGMNPLILPGMG